jgi:ligand-binding SRPBCC domain-containing protein
MAGAELAYEWRVEAPPQAVYEHLADPRSYVGLTPYLSAVAGVAPGVDEQGRDYLGYTAVERLPLAAGLVWRNRIAVRLYADPPALRLVQQVTSPGRVRLTSTVTLAADSPAGTVVRERIALVMPRPLRGFVLRHARAAQVYRAAELARRLATG